LSRTDPGAEVPALRNRLAAIGPVPQLDRAPAEDALRRHLAAHGVELLPILWAANGNAALHTASRARNRGFFGAGAVHAGSAWSPAATGRALGYARQGRASVDAEIPS
jgi:hypothetical protein